MSGSKKKGKISSYLNTPVPNPLTEEGLEKILKKIEVNHKKLEEIKNNMISREDFEKAISNFNKKIKKMENDITNVKEELVEVKLERDELKSTVLVIKGRLEIEEKEKKRKNIIIHGLNTPETSNLEEEVKKVVNKLKIKIDIKNIKKLVRQRMDQFVLEFLLRLIELVCLKIASN